MLLGRVVGPDRARVAAGGHVDNVGVLAHGEAPSFVSSGNGWEARLIVHV